MRTKIVLSLAALLALQYQLATQSKQIKPREPVIVPPEAGALVGGLRGQGNWKLTKDQTGGSIAISESYAVNAATEFPPAHVHTCEDELWRRQTQIYKADGRNIEMIATGINGRGQRIRSGYVGAYDGQDYPVTGDAKGETVAQLRIDYYTVTTTTKIGGKITGASARVISKDGTVMTITTSGTDGKAVEFNDTLVFRKR